MGWSVTAMKKAWKILMGCCCVFLLAAAGIFAYKDYYTLKEADLILFMGQSNMSGAEGNADLAPKLIKGAAYECCTITNPEVLEPLTEPFGAEEHREGYLDDRGLLERQGTMVTAFVNAYYQETKERVVAVSASRGSARISSYNEYLYEDVIWRLETAKETMEAQNVNIRNIYMVMFIGETDAYLETDGETYIGEMQQLLNKLQPYGVSKCFVIQTGNVVMEGIQVDTLEIQQAQEQLCKEDPNFVLISTLPKEFTGQEYLPDLIHFNQEALNKIGTDAGKNMGKYVAKENEK